MALSRFDDTDAWLDSHRAPLIGFVLPLVNGDLQAAEDVVQETMLRGWQHSTELEPERATAVQAACGLTAGDAVFFVAGKPDEAAKFAGVVRTRIGTDLDLKFVPAFGPHHSARAVALFEHEHLHRRSELLQSIGHGQARDACADDDDFARDGLRQGLCPGFAP